MTRFNAHDITPSLARPMMALSAALSETDSVSRQLRSLLECRVSQLNGCAFCLRMHAKSYLGMSGDPDKLQMLTVWRAANDFSQAERAALHWAECLTQNTDTDKLDDALVGLRSHYDEDQVSTLTFIVSTINAWNRLGIAQHKLA